MFKKINKFHLFHQLAALTALTVCSVVQATQTINKSKLEHFLGACKTSHPSGQEDQNLDPRVCMRDEERQRQRETKKAYIKYL